MGYNSALHKFLSCTAVHRVMPSHVVCLSVTLTIVADVGWKTPLQ